MNKKITREMILYLFFGVLTTLVNWLSYKLFYDVFKVPVALSTAISWLLSVVFAFLTNKSWVFSGGKKSAVKEAYEFFLCRVGTGILDVIFMYVTVEMLSFNDDLMKLLSNVIIIILNYIASKFFVFKKS